MSIIVFGGRVGRGKILFLHWVIPHPSLILNIMVCRLHLVVFIIQGCSEQGLAVRLRERVGNASVECHRGQAGRLDY